MRSFVIQSFVRSGAKLRGSSWKVSQHALSGAAAAKAAQKLDDASVPNLDKFMKLEERKRMRRSLEPYDIPSFDNFLAKSNLELKRTETTVIQINIGLYCNQSCNHCHVESSPQRTEMMDRTTVDRILYLLQRNPAIDTVDVTGGAPELNREWRYLIENVRALRPDITIIDRCNLTVLYEEGQSDLKHFYKQHDLKLICSLPCYSKKNVTRQRGKGVFDKSIQALIDLNSIGYGIPDSGLEIDLVYNPVGAHLPPDRESLELTYKRELTELFDIKFNYLHCFNNQPIKRYADFLYRRGELGQYMSLLVNNFNPSSVDGLMCRNTVNVSWSGHIFDCDFNQMLEMPMSYQGNYSLDSSNPVVEQFGHTGPSVFDIDNLDLLTGADIATAPHCYACTAGAGSKCGT